MFKYPLLLQLIRQPQIAGGLSPKDWEIVISQARRSALLIMLEGYLRDKDPDVQIPDYVLDLLRSTECVVKKQGTSIRWEATKLIKIIQGKGLQPIFLKGAAYILAELEAAKGRLLSDIDILIPKSAISDVELALTAHGWHASKLDEYDQRYFREWMHEIPPLVHIKSNTTLDVHHTILALTAKYSPNADLLFKDAVETPFPGAFVLAPEDMLLHSVAHLFHEGELEMGLKGLIDIERLLLEFLEDDPDFWSRLLSRAKTHQLERPLYYALHYCQLILKLDVPEGVLQQLAFAQPAQPLSWLMDFLYLRALMPDHPCADQAFTRLSRFLLYLRGHYLRMPLRVLIPHLIKKSWMRHKQKQQTRQITGPAQAQNNQ